MILVLGVFATITVLALYAPAAVAAPVAAACAGFAGIELGRLHPTGRR
jgi:hypothetical protein